MPGGQFISPASSVFVQTSCDVWWPWSYLKYDVNTWPYAGLSRNVRNAVLKKCIVPFWTQPLMGYEIFSFVTYKPRLTRNACNRLGWGGVAEGRFGDFNFKQEWRRTFIDKLKNNILQLFWMFGNYFHFFMIFFIIMLLLVSISFFLAMFNVIHWYCMKVYCPRGSSSGLLK